jgi:hypothetical protein
MRAALIPFVTLAALTALMLWRDLKSGRIYKVDSERRYDSDDEYYDTKADSPVSFRLKTSLAAIAALAGITLGFFPAFATETESGLAATILCGGIQILYLAGGLIGRASSWVRNYGSVDKKW